MEKKDENRKHLKLRLAKYVLILLKPFKSKLVVVCLFLGISLIIGFFQPLLIRSITDEGIMKEQLEILIISVLLLLLSAIMNAISELLQSKWFAEIYNGVDLSISQQVFHKLLHLKIDYFSDTNASEIINNTQMDIGRVASLVDQRMVMNVGYLFKILSGIAGLLLISRKLSLLVLLIIPIKYFCICLFSKCKEKKSEEYIESWRDYSSWYGENIDGIKEIKLANLVKHRGFVFSNKKAKVLKCSQENTIIDAQNRMAQNILEWLTLATLYLFGGLAVINHVLTIGGVFAFISYSNFVIGPISSIMNIRYHLAQVFPSWKRLSAFLSLDEEVSSVEDIPLEQQGFDIEFSDVSFSYNSERLILKNINFIIKKGEKVAIIGSNGSGKTTLLNLLLKFAIPTQGSISVGKKDIQTYNIDTYRMLYSVVTQAPFLFYDTIENNIASSKNVDQQRLTKALVESGAMDFVNKLPNKSKSKVGRNGARLSGGEKQKIAVARAIYNDAPIIIMDEATSGFDVESNEYLNNVIFSKLQNRTVIVITHRYFGLDEMDKVFSLSEGSLSLIDIERELY